MTRARGWCAPRFEPVLRLLEDRLESGDDVGASVCVIQDDEVVVDLWGGLADRDSGTPWSSDTLVNTYSLTKTMMALVVLGLIDRGVLDPDVPVAHYWPEFAAAGKQDVLVRHVLGHTSGLSTWQHQLSVEDLCDVERSAAMLAAQPAAFRPGDGPAYQAISHGHLVGEIVRRVTGRTLGAMLHEDFAVPTGADYWLGAPDAIDDRLAVLIPPPKPSGPHPTPRGALVNPSIPLARTRTREFLAAELGGLNGQGHARSVAQLQSIISHDGVRAGRRYLSPSTVERIFDVQADGVDRELGAHVRFGLGFGLPTPDSMPAVPEGRVCWWTGFGGSVVVNDLDRNTTIAYVMNKLHRPLIDPPNGRAYLEAAYAALDG